MTIAIIKKSRDDIPKPERQDVDRSIDIELDNMSIDGLIYELQQIKKRLGNVQHYISTYRYEDCGIDNEYEICINYTEQESDEAYAQRLKLWEKDVETNNATILQEKIEKYQLYLKLKQEFENELKQEFEGVK